MCYHELHKQLVEANIIKMDFKTGVYFVDDCPDLLVKKLLQMNEKTVLSAAANNITTHT